MATPVSVHASVSYIHTYVCTYVQTHCSLQAWHSGLLEELSGFSWLLGAKEHRHLAGLKQTVVGACQEHLGDCRGERG